ncbi:MAG: alpha/beta fold hydrolase [Candidatus Sedimenticola sp. PURPLELP]
MPNLQNPVIVIPGISATSMDDRYPVKPNELWSAVLNKEYERISLHPDNPRFEAVEPSLVRPGQIFSLVYADLVAALRYDLTSRSDHPTPVFPFPYDWRQKLEITGDQLHEFIEEVIARTRLLRHYKGYGEAPKVDIVGHSMGGLVTGEYLHKYGSRGRVGKVATLGTPFQGAVEAVVKLLTGMGNLSGTPPREREREASRSMASVYQLLPSFAKSIIPVGDPKPEKDLYKVSAWQPGILESLEEYIRLHSVEPGNRQTRGVRAEALLQTFLRQAKKHRSRIDNLDLSSAGLNKDDWMAVVGMGAKTRISLTVGRDRRGPRFEINNDQFVNHWKGDKTSRLTGDSTVPLNGAIPRFLDEEQIIAVTPDDFGFWEISDQAILGVSGFHAILPRLNLSQRLVLKHLKPDYRGDLGGRPLPGIEASDWRPPVAIQP